MTFVPSENSDPATSEVVINDGFYPDLLLDEFQSRMDVGDDVQAARMINVVTEAMYEINASLSEWRLTLVEYTTLEDVPSDVYGTVIQKIWLYEAAIFNRARALLLETRRDYDTTKAGRDKADMVELPSDTYFRASHEALTRLMDRPRSTIELI